MYARNISFGKENSMNFGIYREVPKYLEEKLVNYEVINDELYIHHNDEIIKLIDNSFEQKSYIELIRNFNDKTLLRVDKINEQSVYITCFIFQNKIEFEQNENFIINIDKNLELDLKDKFDINTDAISFFTQQFILDDKCFALINDDEPNVIILIGDNYTCRVEKSVDDYLIAKGLRKRNRLNFSKATLLSGNISFTDEVTNQTKLTYETNEKYLDSIKDKHELLKLWELYNELEYEAAKFEIDEMGIVQYDSYEKTIADDDKIKITFKVSEKINPEFLNASMGYALLSDEGDDTFIGSEIEISSDKRSFSIYCNQDISYLPPSGYITGSFHGSEIMNKRRNEAMNKIENGETPMGNLKEIIQSGEIVKINSLRHSPVNDKLLRKIFGDKEFKFTERQREAIEIAINTPDIAIIQGPPGTGKTTIIRAIIQRIGDIYDSKARILVSSAQHDAVDNAIENVEYGGLPVNRIGKKYGQSESASTKNIWKWLEDLSDKCDSYMESENISNQRSEFRKIYMSIEVCRKNIYEKEIIKDELMKIYDISMSANLDIEILKSIENMLKSLKTNKSTSSCDIPEYILHELNTLIDSQRVEKEGFLTDGRTKLLRLMSFIGLYDEIEFEIPKEWISLRKVLNEDDVENLEQMLQNFKLSLEDLKNSTAKNDDKEESDSEVYYQKQLEETFEIIKEGIKNHDKNSKDMLGEVVWQFKDQLNNPQNLRSLVAKYTKINAATCQQSASRNLRYNENNRYDYVIIDEAARANPLDLLIPMSMGRKVILVGDHKQLPHLLEKEVVEKIVEKKRDKEVEALLEESLFSRLYNMLDKSKYTNRKRTAMLKEQYRMHPTIGKIVSEFYDEELLSMSSIESKEHNLGLYQNKPIAWLDVSREVGMENSINAQSKCREVEVKKTMDELYKILRANEEYSIGIITFYKKQSVLIQNEVNKLPFEDQKRICVGTVDAFQGKEFDVVILSTVRSNEHLDKRKRVGFLESKNRLCVAFSRAKRLLIGIGDIKTVGAENGTTYIKELQDFYDLCGKEGYCE